LHFLQIVGAVVGLGIALWGAASGLQRIRRGEDLPEDPPVIEPSHPDPGDVP